VPRRSCGQRGDKLVDYEMTVLTFGATCSPALAQYVKMVNASRYEEEFLDAVRAINEDHGLAYSGRHAGTTVLCRHLPRNCTGWSVKAH
jgi:hypothetical protein